MRQPNNLYNKEFITINFILFFTAITMAIFFRLHPYLQSLNINPAWIGPIMSADSMAGMFLQPVFGMMFTAGNARRWIYLGISGLAIALLLYNVSFSAPALIAVRILQGVGSICVLSAFTAFIAVYIPMEKSGQAFGLITTVRLLPFALVPPIMDYCFPGTGGFISAIRYSVVIMVCAMAMLFFLKPVGLSDAKRANAGRLSIKEILSNFRNTGISMLLLTNILLYTGYSTVFFFLAGYCKYVEIANPGLFFAVATFVMIGVRFSCAALFDRFSKLTTTAVCMAGLAVCYISLPVVTSGVGFYAIAFFTGLGWGIAMPVLMAAMFDISPPSFRGLNLNVSLTMVLVGFFCQPYCGRFYS